MSQWEEYPMWLHHPGERAAVLSEDVVRRTESGEVQVVNAPRGTPMQFPPVLVNGPEQREMYEARGYAAGPMSAAAAATARAAPIPNGYAHKDYPRMENGVMVQDPSIPPPSNEYPKWVRRDGVEKLVQDREEEDRLFPPLPVVPPAPPDSEWEPEKAPTEIGDIGTDQAGKLWIWVALDRLMEVKLPLAATVSPKPPYQRPNAHQRRA